MATTRELTAYLVVKPDKRYTSSLKGRLTTRTPALATDEVAIRLSVNVPDMLFRRPQLQATVTIPQNAVSCPEIDATVIDNVREILEQKTGLDITIAVIQPLEATP